MVVAHTKQSARGDRDSRTQGSSPKPLRLPQPVPRVKPAQAVERCYTIMDVARTAGILDLADGEYLPSDTSLEDGIRRQLNFLLDQVGCTRPGFRLLEIGCGYGRLLRLARERGARVVGVNVSAEQVQYCRRHGSQVYCCTYRDLLDSPDWYAQFDGVIANGSLEHWVQPEDVHAGRMDEIYRESFEIAGRMIDPLSPDGRYVTTALHVREMLDPDELLRPWYRQPRGSSRRMFSLLHQWFGGYYPVFGQLEQCAKEFFSLESQVDGTEGYRIASEFRMMRMRRAVYTRPRVLWGILKDLACHPWTTATLLNAYFIEQAWDWQFRGEEPPTRLLRQTWNRSRTGDPSVANVMDRDSGR